jgi:hypothetical protein
VSIRRQPDGLAPIDALASTVAGRYEDPQVTVVAAPARRRGQAEVSTAHFDLDVAGGRVHVTHSLPPSAVDDDLAGLLAEELFGPGWLRGSELFERLFTGVVRTSDVDALAAWELFYRNTLARLSAPREAPADGPGHGSGHGSIDGYAPVHQHALGLLEGGPALELGCCFGFLSLQVARTGRPTVASDPCRGTTGLLAAVAPRLGVRLTTVTADAGRFPGPDGLADTVLVVHLLQGLDPEHGARVVAEGLRLAARRLVVAVPLEDEPDETYGHVCTLTLDDLRRWGRTTGRPFDVHEHHGGWLVVDAG